MDIIASGSATFDAEPELAEITAVIRVRGTGPDQVLRGAAERGRTGTELIDGYGTAIERYEKVGPTADPEDWHGLAPAYPGAWVGTMTLTVGVTDFAVLGELVTKLAAMEFTEICGPRWSLRPHSEVHRRALRAAVDDAVFRGREYAQAVGCRLTGMVELADRGLTTTASKHPAVGQIQEELLMYGAVLPLISLTPERQTVRARVRARLTATAPENLSPR